MDSTAPARERKLFGTDGVRGVANIEPMTTETAMRLGRAVAHLFQRAGHGGKIVIGEDTHLSMREMNQRTYLMSLADGGPAAS